MTPDDDPADEPKSRLPDGPFEDKPEDNEMLPPLLAVVVSVVEPDVNVRAPPSPLFPLPTDSDNAPPPPLVASPVHIVTVPLEPLVDTPDPSEIIPL